MLPFKVSCGALFKFDGWGYKALTDFKVAAPTTTARKPCEMLDIPKGATLFINREAGTFSWQGKTYEGAWVEAALRDNLLIPVLSLANLLGRAKHEPRVNEFKLSHQGGKTRVKHVQIEDYLAEHFGSHENGPRHPPLTPIQRRKMPDTGSDEYKAFSDDVRTGLCDLDETDAAVYTLLDPEDLNKEPPTNLSDEERALVDDPDFWFDASEIWRASNTQAEPEVSTHDGVEVEVTARCEKMDAEDGQESAP